MSDGGDDRAGGTPALHPEDREALAAFGRGSEWLRGAACTLARRGVAFRLADPDRAEAIVAELAPSPIFKAGQFLFDLLEWEDFMVDGAPPAIVPTTLDPLALRRLAGLLEHIRGYIDGGVVPGQYGSAPVELVPFSAADEALPPLEAGFYLYHDVVLGLVASTRGAATAPPGAV
jgi:hypothetical protein